MAWRSTTAEYSTKTLSRPQACERWNRGWSNPCEVSSPRIPRWTWSLMAVPPHQWQLAKNGYSLISKRQNPASNAPPRSPPHWPLSKAFRAKRIGVLTPYTAEINNISRRLHRLPTDFRCRCLARLTNHWIQQYRVLHRSRSKLGCAVLPNMGQVDVVFVSCTSVRLLETCAALEESLDIPVISSNQAMAWHALRLARIDDVLPQFGSLYRLPLPM